MDLRTTPSDLSAALPRSPFELAFERSPLAQTLVSVDGSVRRANSALARLLDAHAPDLVDTSLATWFSGADRGDRLGADPASRLVQGTESGAPLLLELQLGPRAPLRVRVHSALHGDQIWIALEPDEKNEGDAPNTPGRRQAYVVETLPVVVWGIDRNGTFLFSEGKALESLGLGQGEVVGRDVFELYRYTPDILNSVRRALAGDEHYSVARVSGRVWYTRYAPTRIDGTIEGIAGVSVDITEHDHAESELREVREQLHSVVNAAPILLWSTDHTGRLSLVEGLGLERLGRRATDLLGRSIHEIGSPLNEIAHALENASDGQDRTVVIERDGQTWENRFRPRRDAQGQMSGIVGVSLDVTDRASAEQALEESRADRDALLECTHQMIFSLDDDQRLVSWNSAWAAAMREWLEFEPEAGMPLIGPAQDPVKRDRWQSWYRRALAGDRFQVDYVIDLPGGVRHFEVSFTPIAERDAEGRPTGKTRGATCFMNDITPRKRAENALRESEEELRAILDSVAEGVIATDAAECVVQMNPVAEQLTGWRSADARGTRLDRLFEALDPQTRVGHAVPDHLGAVPRDLLLVARDGRESRVAVSITALRNARGARRGSVLVLRDRSEETAAEDSLRQGQKMEAVGQLAAGVAHDFNNLLAGIMGHAELLEDCTAADPQAGRHVAQIRAASSRAADLTAQLLSFSRKHPLRKQAVDVHTILEDAVRLLEHSVDRLIAFERRFDAPLSRVTGDPSQLQSAFLNLGVNARDAMPQGGTIVFATRVLDLGTDSSGAASKLDPSGEYLEVRVIDTGVGMDADTLERIFEPFFTTKPEGEGTGLGLAGAYGCIEQHEGAIDVESRAGHGTTIRVLLPLAEALEAQAPVPGSDVAGANRALESTSNAADASGDTHGHVLVIDDEETVRNLARNALSLEGYEVTLAEDGPAGVEVLRGICPPVDIVVLDMVMPKCSGEETFRLLREVDAEVPILLVSGFSNSRSCNALLKEGALGLLPKPFRIDELRQRVRAGIESRR